MARSADTLIKVCGLTRQQDADACVALGANFGGFIFHPASPRCVTPEQVRAIDTGSMMRVGVFVDQSPKEVRDIMYQARLNLAQLHGDQDVAFCEEIGKLKVMRAFWPERYETREAFIADLEKFAPYCRFYLYDAGTSGGGHGKSMDFSFLDGLKSYKTWLLAGGLSADNVAQALDACHPCGVDLNSGVESAPGIKDREKLARTIALARGQGGA